MEHATRDELLAAIAERRMQELAYKGMNDLSRDIRKRPFRFDLFRTNEDLKRAIQIIEFRNVVVHNRSEVNNVLVSRLPDLGLKVGERLHLEYDQLWRDILFLASSVKNIDQRAVPRWDLPVRPQQKTKQPTI